MPTILIILSWSFVFRISKKLILVSSLQKAAVNIVYPTHYAVDNKVKWLLLRKNFTIKKKSISFL